MRKDLQIALFNDFPNLYRTREGFQCEDGWEPLIRRLSEKLEPLVKGTEVCAVQIKQKFGQLRLYTKGSVSKVVDTHIWQLIEEATVESEKTCETCGETGRVRNVRGAIHIACEKHYEALQKHKSKTI